MSQPPIEPFRVWKGVCHLMFQYDVGQSVDLEQCKRLIAAQPAPIRQEHRAPAWFQFNPPPLLVTEDTRPVAVGRFRTAPRCTSVVYDFGAVSVSYAVPFEGTLADLVDLGGAVREADGLWEDSLDEVQRLLDAIRPAVTKPRLADPTEDYAIFQVEELDPPGTLSELPRRFGHELAQILRGERDRLSDEEASDAISSCVAYGPDDLALIDWQAALLVGRGWGDVRAVLELASVQLLEMRFLDQKLDDVMDRSYETLNARRRPWFLPAPSLARDMVRVSRMQVDAAILFERVTNALKLLGDQYLARLYRLASQRFRLDEWNATILRKLDTVEGIYQKLNDQAGARRMELLEWIIIVLIAVSMVLPFVTGGLVH